MFMKELMLETTHLGENPTFHHNNGTSESQIDHILTNKPEMVSFLTQPCKLDDPTNLSSHDAIIGKIKLPETIEENDAIDYSDSYEDFIPKKIVWKDNPEYQDMTAKIVHNCQAQPSSNSSWAELALLSLYPPAVWPAVHPE